MSESESRPAEAVQHPQGRAPAEAMALQYRVLRKGAGRTLCASAFSALDFRAQAPSGPFGPVDAFAGTDQPGNAESRVAGTARDRKRTGGRLAAEPRGGHGRAD